MTDEQVVKRFSFNSEGTDLSDAWEDEAASDFYLRVMKRIDEVKLKEFREEREAKREEAYKANVRRDRANRNKHKKSGMLGGQVISVHDDEKTLRPIKELNEILKPLIKKALDTQWAAGGVKKNGSPVRPERVDLVDFQSSICGHVVGNLCTVKSG